MTPSEIQIDRLFEPLRVGNASLRHRVVMAPLTRFRGSVAHLLGPYAKLYYEQRASTVGTLIITEATFVSARAGGYPFVPGIWNGDQVEGCKVITDAVHTLGSFIILQIVATGRSANPAYIRSQGHDLVSPSLISIDIDHEVPRALSDEGIASCIDEFSEAAKNAMLARFDGVEIHGANGYLVDQFWQDVSNKREDRWGGNIENRARFGLEVAKAVIAAVGDSKMVGMRLSPWSTYQSMRMTDPVAQFFYIAKELKDLGLGYLHLFESRSSGSSADGIYQELNRENDVFVEAWGRESHLLLAGGYNDHKAARVLNELYPDHNICIVFGRQFLSNPDLPFRIRNGIDLNPYDRETFYKFQSLEGYVDYPFSDEWLQMKGTIAET